MTCNSTCLSASNDVDKQVELHVTQDESESPHQGEQDQHNATVTNLAESSSHQSSSSKAHRPSLALDKARRVSVRPPRRYGFEDMVTYALQVV